MSKNQTENTDCEFWEINIENAVSTVVSKYGYDVAASVFERYGAHDFSDLASCYYGEVFADLEQIIND